MRLLGRRDNRPGKTASLHGGAAGTGEDKENLDAAYSKSVQKLSKSELRQQCTKDHLEIVRWKERLRATEGERDSLQEKLGVQATRIEKLEAETNSLRTELDQEKECAAALREREERAREDKNQAEAKAEKMRTDLVLDSENRIKQIKQQCEGTISHLKTEHEQELQGVYADLSELANTLTALKEVNAAQQSWDAQSEVQEQEPAEITVQRGLQEFLDDVAVRDQDITFLFSEMQSLKDEIKKLGKEMEAKEAQAAKEIAAANRRTQKAQADLEWEEEELHRMQKVLKSLEAKLDEQNWHAHLQAEKHASEVQNYSQLLHQKEAHCTELEVQVKRQEAKLVDADTSMKEQEIRIEELTKVISEQSVAVEETHSELESVRCAAVKHSSEVKELSNELLAARRELSSLQQEHNLQTGKLRNAEEQSHVQLKCLQEQLAKLSEKLAKQQVEIEKSMVKTATKYEQGQRHLELEVKDLKSIVAERNDKVNFLSNTNKQLEERLEKMKTQYESQIIAINESITACDSLVLKSIPLVEVQSIITGYEANVSLISYENANLEAHVQRLCDQVTSQSHQLMQSSQQNIACFATLQEENRQLEAHGRSQQAYIQALWSEKEQLGFQVRKLEGLLSGANLEREKFKSASEAAQASAMGRIKKYEGKIRELECRIRELEDEKSDAEAQWSTESSSLKEKLDTLRKGKEELEQKQDQAAAEIKRLQSDLEESREATISSKAKSEELCLQLQHQQRLLETSQAETANLIKQLEAKKHEIHGLWQENKMAKECSSQLHASLKTSQHEECVLRDHAAELELKLQAAWQERDAAEAALAHAGGCSDFEEAEESNALFRSLQCREEIASGRVRELEEQVAELVQECSLQQRHIKELGGQYDEAFQLCAKQNLSFVQGVNCLSNMLKMKFADMELAVQRSDTILSEKLQEAQKMQRIIADLQHKLEERDTKLAHLAESKDASDRKAEELRQSLQALEETQELLHMAVRQTEENELEFQKLKRTLEESHLADPCSSESDEES